MGGLEEELPQRVLQTIKATKSMLTVFFNPKQFTLMTLLPQGTSVTAARFVDKLIIPVANGHAQLRENIARRKLNLHFGNSKSHAPHCVSGKCPFL
jgi:hypothetical protein